MTKMLVVVALAIQTAVMADAQSLGEAARRAEEARKNATPATVTFDMRDIDPGLARQELLGVQIDEGRWTRLLAADPGFARALAADHELLQRFQATEFDSVRALEKFILREPALVQALTPLAPREYAATHLAVRLALQESRGSALAIEALPPAVKANVAFMKSRDIKALAAPPAKLVLQILPAETRIATTPVLAIPGARPSASGSPAPPAADGPIDMSPGREIPDFRFVDFNGSTRNLADFRGRYLMLDFWGSWCPPCRAEVPFAREAYARFRSRGFEILGMDYERGASVDQVRAYLNENGVTWTIAQPDSVKSLIDDRFRIDGFPTIVLLGPDGRVLDISESALRGRNLATTLDRVLPR